VLDETAEASLTGCQLQLGCLAIIDLARGHHDAVDLGIAAHVGDEDFEPIRGAIGGFEADLPWRRLRCRRRDQLAELGSLFGNGQIDDRRRTQIVVA
jgi:hypothetical protein